MSDQESFSDRLFTASTFLAQARGIIEAVIALKPTAGQLNDGEIGQALYASVDQINRALEIVDSPDEASFENEPPPGARLSVVRS